LPACSRVASKLEIESKLVSLIVFLKGVNVGGHKTFRPSILANELARFGVMNFGAAGTFVVRRRVSRTKVRLEFGRRLPFETEAMICSRNELLQLASAAYWEPCGPGSVRFASRLAKRPRMVPALPLNLPPGEDWLVRLLGIRGKFAFGLYRRTMRTIAVMAQLEKHLGCSLTTRSWNTFLTLFEILSDEKSRGNPALEDR